MANSRSTPAGNVFDGATAPSGAEAVTEAPRHPARAFRATLLAGWAVLSIAAVLYARAKGIPTWAALPAAAAFLLEYPFYLVPAFPSIRERLAGQLIPYFLLAALFPYLICCYSAIPFQATALIRLTALTLGIALWYRVLPVNPATDIAFLLFVPTVLLGRYFDTIYPAPVRGLDLVVLGHITLIQMAVMVLMLERRVPETGYGFLPRAAEWRTGALNYLYFAAIGFPLALGLHAVRYAGLQPLWKIAGAFLATLWVVALSEEFFFRGVLQRWLEDWTRHRATALVLASLAFGAAHLWFRGFPNWRWALIATVLGFFCGRARNEAGNIRASMVTHALVVATWRAFFV